LALLLALPIVGSLEGASEAPLADAVQRRDTLATQALLKKHVDVNAPQADGTTALHWAAHWNDISLARQLIAAGAKVDAVTRLGIMPLSLACTDGSAQMVKLLLEVGANAKAALPTGETALMTCARNGTTEPVKLLLAAGADVQATEQERGQTALMWAAARDNADVVRLLIDAGANVNTKTKTLEGSGVAGAGGLRGNAGGAFAYSALLFAARNGNTETVKVLLEKGANVNDVASDGASVLLTAVHEGQWELAHLLLAKGADPNIDKSGYTVLHWAVGAWENDITGLTGAKPAEYKRRAALGAGKLELIKDLIAHGANPNTRVVRFQGGAGRMELPGSTPFLLAAHAADVDVMRALVAAGADPNLVAKDHTTPLMMAVGYGRAQGKSHASENDSLEAAKLALDLGNDINAANDIGETAMHAAAYWGVDSLVQFLFDHGAKLNPYNKAGSTPMQLAEGFSDRSTGGNNISNPSTAALLKKLGGSDVVELHGTIDYLTDACPHPVITLKREAGMVDPSTGGDGRGISIEGSQQTKFDKLSCADLKGGMRVLIRGGRDMSKGWNGLVQATEIVAEK
jgi:ankyrin repeat protein